MKLVPLVILIVLAFFFSQPAFSADEMSSFSLTLEDASRLAIENSYDIQLLKYDAWLARTKKGWARSIYDTVLNGEVNYHNDQSLKASTIFGTKTIDNDYNAGLVKKLPTGTTMAVDITNNRNATNSGFATSSVTHDSSLGLSLTQSLGRNLFGIEDRGGVKITENEILMSQYTSFERMEDFMASVQKAYWDLAAHIEKKTIELQMVDQAKKLFDSQSEKFKNGLVEKAELIAAQANYQQRVSELKILENLIKSKTNILRLILNIHDNDSVIIATSKMSLDVVLPVEAEVLKTALENRWDFKALRADSKAQSIRLSVDKNSLWPQIDLKASFRRNGLGDHFNRAIENISNEDNPDFMTGLQVSFPLENTKASAQYRQAQLNVARNLVSLKLLERKIVLGVMDQWRDCQVLREVAQSQEAIAVLQAEKLGEESKRFGYGRSNTDQIIRFQEDVLTAQIRAIDAKEEFVTAAIELDKRQGLLLKRYLSEDFLKE